mgnify:CR=1 FL=1
MHLTDKKLTTVVSEKMKGFPEDTIKEVLDFIEFLCFLKGHILILDSAEKPQSASATLRT